jgi:hypothetical protein
LDTIDPGNGSLGHKVTFVARTLDRALRVFASTARNGQLRYVMPVYHVLPLPGGRWEVRHEGGASAIYDQKEIAITAATELARAASPGTVKIHGLDGRVESRIMGERDRPTTRR